MFPEKRFKTVRKRRFSRKAPRYANPLRMPATLPANTLPPLIKRVEPENPVDSIERESGKKDSGKNRRFFLNHGKNYNQHSAQCRHGRHNNPLIINQFCSRDPGNDEGSERHSYRQHQIGKGFTYQSFIEIKWNPVEESVSAYAGKQRDGAPPPEALFPRKVAIRPPALPLHLPQAGLTDSMPIILNRIGFFPNLFRTFRRGLHVYFVFLDPESAGKADGKFFYHCMGHFHQPLRIHPPGYRPRCSDLFYRSVYGQHPDPDPHYHLF